jgi:putative peptidoglycan lipid II flippase
VSTSPGRTIAIAALLIAVGNITSRLIGVIREAVFAATFGRGAELAAFTAAATIPTLLYDLLLSGAMSAALVPVFSRFANQPKQFARTVSQVMSLLVIIVGGLIVPLLLAAPFLVRTLAGGFDSELQTLTTSMVRWMVFAVPSMIIAGVMTAALQAQQQFLLPAFVTSVFNIGLITAAWLFSPLIGPIALALGMVLGAVLQVVMQYQGLRKLDWQWLPDWRSPEVIEIGRLYAPVALGMFFSALGTIIDRRYASDFGEDVLPTMRYATTLIQFPLGLVAAAVSTAILPTLSRLNSTSSLPEFRQTVANALHVVMALIVPASLILWLVRIPLTAFILERQAFLPEDTIAVANTLTYYIPGMPAAAIDQILLFACYARGRTLAPNLVQAGAIIAYVLAVMIGIPWLGERAETLAWANSVQWIAHMLIMLVICQRMFDLRGLGLLHTLLLTLIAAAVTWAVMLAVLALIPLTTLPVFLQLLLISLMAGSTYLLVSWRLEISPVIQAYQLIFEKITQRIQKRTAP